jgi:hypothetical protein
MFGADKTYFADSPVVIDISGLRWPGTSPFNVVRIEVVTGDDDSSGSGDEGLTVVGSFKTDTGGQSAISFDISSALRAIWNEYRFENEVTKANAALSGNSAQSQQRDMSSYYLRIYTEYIASDGVFTTTECTVVIEGVEHTLIPGGQCLIGWLTEWERSTIGDKANADVSHWEHTGVRNGDASTKPVSSPERVGKNSITSWVDVQEGYTKSIFYPKTATPEPDDNPLSQTGWTGHAPIVLRDDIDYQDFLFVNRRGAVETCSALMLAAMNIDVETKSYARIKRPSFKPSRSLMSISQGGPRRDWVMSSGLQTREWAEWWAMEFLTARQWWMLYKGSYVPVVVEPAKKSTGIYDRTKQQMPSVEFTVTLALEG